MNALQIDITWDPAKAQLNITKHHGVTFAQAATVLLDTFALTVFDAANSALVYVGHVQRWQTAGGIAHLSAYRDDPGQGMHHFCPRRDRALMSANNMRMNPGNSISMRSP